jgi:type VI protein secretion system component VasK|tara:strand:+ start:773 stop:982 length:210 start_codon:yes stop_codon:yes gene_type:complete
MKNVLQILGLIGVIILLIVVWGFIIKYLVSDLEQLKYALSVCFTVGVIVVVSRLFTSYSSNKIKKKRKK